MPREMNNEPVFVCWVTYTIKNLTRIIAAVNYRYHKRMHKFGVRIPTTVDDAYYLDK